MGTQRRKGQARFARAGSRRSRRFHNVHAEMRFLLRLRPGEGRPGAARLEKSSSRSGRSPQAQDGPRHHRMGGRTRPRGRRESERLAGPALSGSSTICPKIASRHFSPFPCSAAAILVGVINLQHRDPHRYSDRQVRLISAVGLLGGSGDRAGSPRKRKLPAFGPPRDAQDHRARQRHYPARPETQ